MGERIRQEIRKEMRLILANLDSRWLKAASAEVCRNLSDLISKNLIGRYEFILAWTKFFPGEPDLSSFIGWALDKEQVYLPRTLSDMSMEFINIGKNWGDDIEPGTYGIPEPGNLAGENFNLHSGDKAIVIIPGLAFDLNGNRLGRGKGYYDRFLSRSGMENCVRVGVCWSLQIVESIQAKPHDIPVDWICHENGFEQIKY